MNRSLRSAALAALLAAHPMLASAAGSTSTQDTVADVITGLVPLGGLAITYVKGDDLGKTQWLRNISAELLLNTVARGLFNETSLGRRPSGNEYGFPSGHVGFVTAGAAFLQERYGWHYGAPAYVLAAYVAYERVDSHHHHTGDVIAAAALSYGVGRLFVTPEDASYLAPVIGPDFMGMRWERSF
ncbi:MAG: phosphatase PAP2 family protein [Stagnimonas sp.]|nr:phosphatase PAP2 family protein [Stagnimonas sp.]